MRAGAFRAMNGEGMSMVERTDDELLVAAGAGDREAFTVLVERYHRDIVRFVYRYLNLRNRETAEDVAQDIFLSAWKSAATYEPRGRAAVWLYRVTTHACLNYRRWWRLRRTVSLDGEPPESASDRSESDPNASARAEAAADVRAALAQLPPRERASIVLRYFHELPYVEIAEVMGLSVPAVESLLFRARKRLRAALSPDESLKNPQGQPELGAE